MAKKAEYIIKMSNGPVADMTVKGEIIGEWWGIHKREDKGGYALTHLPTGYLVWSSKKKGNLVKLLQEPEFFEIPDHEDAKWRVSIAAAIKRWCDKNGWE